MFTLVKVASLIIYDLFAIELASFLAFFIRFEFKMTTEMVKYYSTYADHRMLIMTATILIFAFCHLYSSMWTYASIREMLNIVLATILYMLLVTFVFSIFEPRSLGFPRSFYILSSGFLFVFVFFGRFIYRGLRELKVAARGNKVIKRVMIVGAGTAGSGLVREIKANPSLNQKIVCFADDDKAKLGKFMHGIFVAGMSEDIPELVTKYRIDQILIAIPSVKGEERKRILDICKETGCELMTLPGISEIIRGDVSISQLKDVDVNDLLGRDPVEVDIDSIIGYVEEKVVLVTGAGGSIGSELCRQIADHKPKRLIMLDIYENTTYEIQHEIISKHPELNLVVLIASVRNTKRIDLVFEEYRPDIVYHAAAHKHVPLMEANPNEAIKNNVLGTRKVVMAADKWHTKKFVMISTDKAVNPTNIMGASKRICEMIVQTYNNRSETEFVSVRFGNVLGSNGSVIPLFRKQIANGGPVTVTHPEITRFFMTIPEAVSLVLQAGAYAKGGEIFVLDMGEPVKIDDLARNLILLSGFKPDKDIKIEYTGLRPGEKLYEELLMNEEGLQDTENRLIHIGKPIKLDENRFLRRLEELSEYVQDEPKDIRSYILDICPTYKPKEKC